MRVSDLIRYTAPIFGAIFTCGLDTHPTMSNMRDENPERYTQIKTEFFKKIYPLFRPEAQRQRYKDLHYRLNEVSKKASLPEYAKTNAKNIINNWPLSKAEEEDSIESGIAALQKATLDILLLEHEVLTAKLRVRRLLIESSESIKLMGIATAKFNKSQTISEYEYWNAQLELLILTDTEQLEYLSTLHDYLQSLSKVSDKEVNNAAQELLETIQKFNKTCDSAQRKFITDLLHTVSELLESPTLTGINQCREFTGRDTELEGPAAPLLQLLNLVQKKIDFKSTLTRVKEIINGDVQSKPLIQLTQNILREIEAAEDHSEQSILLLDSIQSGLLQPSIPTGVYLVAQGIKMETIKSHLTQQSLIKL